MPGWSTTSWGYHSDEGLKFHASEKFGKRYGETYHKGDTVGCGIDLKTGNVFFTVNGVNLGIQRLNCFYFEHDSLTHILDKVWLSKK